MAWLGLSGLGAAWRDRKNPDPGCGSSASALSCGEERGGRMQWFRMYSEARNDAKLRYLTDGEFRVWFNLLCFSNEQKERGTIPPMSDTLLAVEVAGGDVNLLADTVEKLTTLAIIEKLEDGSLRFVNFRKRNYDHPSDEPERVRERVARCRAKKRIEQVTTCNDRVTSGNALDPDTDLDSEVPPPPPLTPPPPEEEAAEAASEQLREDDDGAISLPEDSVAPVVKFCLESFLPTASHYQVERLVAWVEQDGMEPDLVIWAMEQALLYNHRNFAYVESILNNCKLEGIKTRAGAEERQAAFKRTRDSPRGTVAPGFAPPEVKAFINGSVAAFVARKEAMASGSGNSG
ncbi:MAG: DnaD domain protein [Bacillota bacterium]